MNENNEKNTDLKSDEIKEQKTEELFFDNSHCEEARVSENEAELTHDESEISQSGEEVSAESENILSVEDKETDGAADIGNANAESNEDFKNSSLSEANYFTEETATGESEGNCFTEESENGASEENGFAEESENGISEGKDFTEESENGASEEKPSDTETLPEYENETPSEIFGGEEFRISDEEFSRALKNPMFPMFSRGRNESVEQSVRNFCKMIAAGKNSVSEEDRIRMTPYSGYGVVSDIALSERQKKIAREAGMSYREYYEIIKSLPQKSK